MTVSVLGPTAVSGTDGLTQRRDRIVLATLTLSPRLSVSTERIYDALWNEAPPATAAKVVQGCVVRLRRLLGPDAIRTSDAGYRLDMADDEIDARRFEHMAERARQLFDLGEPHRCAFIAEKSLELWRGTAFEDLAEWPPGRAESDRLDAIRLDTEDLAVAASLQAGKHRELIATAKTRVTAAPLRESRWERLALAQYRAGLHSDALATLRTARRTLRDDLGLDPGPGLRDLEQSMLHRDTALAIADAAAESAACPYPGLVSFDVDDAELYVGRDAVIAECIDRLAARRAVTIVGPSGSGKSSLVRAGIIAQLVREGRATALLNPGPQPETELDQLLRSSRPDAVLLVDQLEAVLAPHVDPAVRERTLARIAEESARRPLVLSVRSDRMGELASDPALSAIIENSILLLAPLSPNQLREAIEEPARLAGLIIEAGLVDLLLRDVEGEPGSLPLLSHALRRTWEAREGRTLTVAGYSAAGGIREAVARSAEAIYESGDDERRRAMRELLLRLVTPVTDAEPTRLRLPRRVVASDPATVELVELLMAARLVTGDESRIELAHDALLTAWPRLRGWLEDDLDGQRLRRHLVEAADAWAVMGRPDSELYRGARLAAVQEWREREGPILSTVEELFLSEGSAAESAVLRQAEAEMVRQRRANRRLRGLLAGAAVLAIAAVTASGLAFVQTGRADAEARTARAQELAASALGAIGENPSLALLLAVSAAADGDRSVQTLSALQSALSAVREGPRMAPLDGMGWLTGSLSPDGTRLAMAGGEPDLGVSREVAMFDTATAAELWTWRMPDAAASSWIVKPLTAPGGEEIVWGVVYDPLNGRRIGGEPTGEPGEHGIAIHDARTGEPIEMLDVGPCGGYPAAVTAELILLRTPAPPVEGGASECSWTFQDPTAVVLLDRGTGAAMTLSTNSPFWATPVMSADGSVVAFQDGESLRVIGAPGGGILLDLPDATPRAMSADGRTMLTGFEPLSVMDPASGAVRATLVTPEGGAAVTAALSDDGTTGWTSGRDGVVRQWDTRTGRELFAYPGVGTGELSIGGDGLVAVTRGDGAEGMVLNPHRWRAPVATDGDADAVHLSADGALRVSITAAGVEVANAETGNTIWSTPIDAGPTDAIFDPAGELVFVSTGDSRLMALGVADGTIREDVYLDLTGGEHVAFVGFSPSGTLLAIGDFQMTAGGDLIRIDPTRLAPVEVSQRIHEGAVSARAMSPDGSRFATSGGEGLIRVWDGESGRLIQQLPFPDVADTLGWVDADTLVAASGDEQTLFTVDPERLIESARASLTRGYTLTDCARFWSDRECPFLAELDPSRRDAESDLDGTFAVDWNTADLAAAMRDATTDRVGIPLDEPSLAAIDDHLPTYVGPMRLRLDDGVWDWRLEGQQDPLCAGTYTRDGSHVRFGVERGTICVGVVLFEAEVTAEEGTLSFTPGTFRGYWADEVPITAREWRRIG